MLQKTFFSTPRKTNGKRTIKLLRKERGIMMNFSSTTLITFYEGETPIEYLEGRLHEMYRANPWLNGRLVTDPQAREPVIQYDEMSSVSVDNDDYNAGNLLQVLNLDLNIQTPYHVMASMCEAAIVKNGLRSLDKDEKLFKVSIIIDKSSRNKFALIVSLSHVAGDGASFYSIYQMLDKDAHIQKLKIDRKFDYELCEQEILGLSNERHCSTFSFLVPFILSKLRRKIIGAKTTAAFLNVSTVHIEKVKRKFMKELEEKKDTDTRSSSSERKEVEFISTNDILTSWFLKLVNAPLGLMAMNMRGRTGVFSLLCGVHFVTENCKQVL
mmetsp:Transcript_13407/g.15955  ORF Transcript_13407/g.15955 Transcript_13407/m.15955 type:complete len:326 (+) Transcript_13407:45-1022(+)